MKKISLWLSALVLLVVAVVSVRSVHAQSPAIDQTPPEVSVTSVTLDKTTYASGDTVTGTIIFSNRKIADQSDVYYDVSLAGDYSMASSSWHIPGTLYDTKTFGPVYVRGMNDASTTFSYKLPAGISGKGLGIHVIAHLETGYPLGWNEAFIDNVTGGISMLTLNTSYVEVDGKNYNTESGPTLDATSTGYAHIVVTNNTGAAITVTPQIGLFDRIATASTTIKTTEGSPVTIGAGAQQDIKIPLDTNNNTPKVYVEEVTLLDAGGNFRAPQVQFRYIVAGGPIATIQTVQADSLIATKGTPINVSVAFSGSPYDITTGVAPSVGQAVLDVKLFDAKTNTQIGESSTSTVNFDVDYGTAILAVTPSSNADSVLVEASIVKDGKTLGQYSTTVTPAGTVVNRKAPVVAAIIILVVVLILIVLFLYLIFKRKKVPPTILSILILVGLSVVIGSIFSVHGVFALSQVACNTNAGGANTNAVGQYSILSVCNYPPSVSSPYNGQAFIQGQAFAFSGVLQNGRCLNANDGTTITGSLDGGQVQSTKYQYYRTGEGGTYNYSLFSFYFGTSGLSIALHTLALTADDFQVQSDNRSVHTVYTGVEYIYVTAPPVNCTGPDGSTIVSGQGKVYYFSTSGTSCPSETRTCTNGTLSGSATSTSCTLICANGGTNYPSCTVNTGGSCINNGTNPPQCTLNSGGSCINGASNPASCTTCGSTQVMVAGQCINECTNGGTNPPSCTVSKTNKCLNGTSNPPACNACPAGQTFSGGACVPNCTNGANNPPACDACPTGQSLYQGICQANCGSVLAGQSVTMYSISAGSATASCSANAEVRTCVKGALTGDASYQYGACTPTYQEF